MSEVTPENRRPLKTRYLAWVQSLAAAIAGRGFTANQISLAGVGFALIGFALLYGAGRWPAGWIFLIPAAVCVQLRLLCNMLDGVIALEGGKKEKGGALYNEVPARVEDALFLVGAGYAAGFVELGWLCAVLAIFTAHVRVLGASFGQAQDFGGPLGQTQRMFLLTAALLVAPFFHFFFITFNVIAWALAVIALGTAITAALRLRRVYGRTP